MDFELDQPILLHHHLSPDTQSLTDYAAIDTATDRDDTEAGSPAHLTLASTRRGYHSDTRAPHSIGGQEG